MHRQYPKAMMDSKAETEQRAGFDLLTVIEVAAILRVKPQSVYPLIQQGRLKAIDVACKNRRAQYRVRRSDLEEFLEEAVIEPRLPRMRNM